MLWGKYGLLVEHMQPFLVRMGKIPLHWRRTHEIDYVDVLHDIDHHHEDFVVECKSKVLEAVAMFNGYWKIDIYFLTHA